MNYLVTGGTGFIGQKLVSVLRQSGHQVAVISRQPETAGALFGHDVLATRLDALPELDFSVDVVVNLAGAPIIDKRWSAARKQVLRHSRIAQTEQLISLLEKMNAQPKVFISGSAIGFYGSRNDDVSLDEQSAVVSGFTHELCRDWEAVAQTAETRLGCRVCFLRTGVVLGPGGGALDKMLTPFKLGLGGPIGHGLQWMSWIHLDDEVAAICFLAEQKTLQGAFNLTAPGAVTNQDLSYALGHALKRPAKLRMPARLLTWMLGEASELLIQGQRVYPKRLLDAGFEFKYPLIDEALAAALDQ